MGKTMQKEVIQAQRWLCSLFWSFLVFVMTETITSSKHLNMHRIMQYKTNACYLLCKPMSMQANKCTGCLIKNISSI